MSISSKRYNFYSSKSNLTGTNSRYFKFDITTATSGSSIYYDGTIFRLSYSTDAFVSEIAKNTKVTISILDKMEKLPFYEVQ